jgi:hypothetical protein
MAASPQTGFFVLADLTGDTAYLSGSGVEQAPVIADGLPAVEQKEAPS